MSNHQRLADNNNLDNDFNHFHRNHKFCFKFKSTFNAQHFTNALFGGRFFGFGFRKKMQRKKGIDADGNWQFVIVSSGDYRKT